MKDSEFLTWIKNRIVYTYGESENADFVHRLEEIIKNVENIEQEKEHVDVALNPSLRSPYQYLPYAHTTNHCKCPGCNEEERDRLEKMNRELDLEWQKTQKKVL